MKRVVSYCILVMIIVVGCATFQESPEAQLRKVYDNGQDELVVEQGQKLIYDSPSNDTLLMLMISAYRIEKYELSLKITQKLIEKGYSDQSLLDEYLLANLYQLNAYDQVVSEGLQMNWYNNLSLSTRILQSLELQKSNQLVAFLEEAVEKSDAKLFKEKLVILYQQNIQEAETNKSYATALEYLNKIIKIDPNQQWAIDEIEFINNNYSTNE